ncbi:GNAT family N-acetyltransferase [Sedimentibacter sp. zth1]|uniref:GNAT family N-acetyltransferase n=1 Tax=Sedimentibacter sp. zth1 TaxID=2816908 RepID=UPI001A913008|nr:GNAT family N-acetyltransferase [Sedimentibacter sp. zth1]QSX05852.1 GNAT family N-acetyltransferase [Sedimentibacter sp. zth1]
MVSTKWVQGINLKEVFKIRNIVFANELKYGSSFIHDEYDSFAKNVLVYDSGKPVGTGRLYFKNGKYIIDKICVLKENRKNSYGELIIRMLVRKAVNIGAEKTYAYVDDKYEKLFKKVDFEQEEKVDTTITMVKVGDVCGSCCG